MTGDELWSEIERTLGKEAADLAVLQVTTTLQGVDYKNIVITAAGEVVARCKRRGELPKEDYFDLEFVKQPGDILETKPQDLFPVLPPNDRQKIEALAKDLRAVIDLFDLSHASIIGVLQLITHELLEEALEEGESPED